MSKHNFNKKIKFYEEIIDNINLLTNNKETKYEVLNNTFNLINALGVNENLSTRKMGKQLKLMMYCEGQINVVSSALKNELKE